MFWEMNILFFYYFIIVCVSFILFYMSVVVKKYFFTKYNIYMDSYEKNLAFECGFNPFDDASSSFEVRFYLVAILFIMFDLEIMFLFPWVMSLNYVGIFGFWVMVMFLFILTVGFIFEWLKGALDWY